MSAPLFVAGATGYVGAALVREALSRGHAVVAHARSDSASLARLAPDWERAGVTVERAPWDRGALETALAGHAPSAVFGLLGTTSRRARAEGMSASEAYERIDFGLTAMLIAATAAAAPGARFVYLSVFGARVDAPRYYAARWRAEEALRASGLAWTIVRPAFITGEDRPERRPLERALAALVDGGLVVAGALGARGLRARHRSLDATTLARGLLAAALDPAAAGAVLGPAEIRALAGPRAA